MSNNGNDSPSFEGWAKLQVMYETQDSNHSINVMLPKSLIFRRQPEGQTLTEESLAVVFRGILKQVQIHVSLPNSSYKHLEDFTEEQVTQMDEIKRATDHYITPCSVYDASKMKAKVAAVWAAMDKDPDIPPPRESAVGKQCPFLGIQEAYAKIVKKRPLRLNHETITDDISQYVHTSPLWVRDLEWTDQPVTDFSFTGTETLKGSIGSITLNVIQEK